MYGRTSPKMAFIRLDENLSVQARDLTHLHGHIHVSEVKEPPINYPCIALRSTSPRNLEKTCAQFRIYLE